MIDNYSLTTKILVQGKVKRGLLIVFGVLFAFVFLIFLFQLAMGDKESVINGLKALIIPVVIIRIAYRSIMRPKYESFGMNIEFYNDFMKVILPSLAISKEQGVHCEVVEINYNDIERMEYNIPEFSIKIQGQMKKIIYKKPNSFDEIVSEVKFNTYDIYMEAKDKEVLLDKLKRYSDKEISYLK